MPLSTKNQAQSQDRDVDAASMLSTSTYASTISRIKEGLQSKDKKASKELKKREKAQEKRKLRESDAAHWLPDINGDNKTARKRTAEAFMITAIMK